MENCFTSDGTSIQLDSKLGGGGEGDVFTYSKNGHADAAQVVKILSPKTLNQDKNKKSKLKVMMQNHPFENVNDKQLVKDRAITFIQNLSSQP